MAFKFAARTLLELGKELISSDGVAINELVKNAIDAGSPKVYIVLHVVLSHRHFQLAQEALLDKKPIDLVIEFIERNLLQSAPEDSRKAFLTALQQSPRTLREFESALRSSYIRFNWMEVRDRGHGMSLEDLDIVYLTVGTRSRRKDNLEGATYLGDKGVGRLSTMRLGNRLEVITTKNGDLNFNHLSIDWSHFGHDVETDVASIDVTPYLGDIKEDKREHGTVVRIADLSSEWTKDRLNELLSGPIARMIDPFEPGRANELLHFEFNDERFLVPNIPQKLLQNAHATCSVSLKFDGTEPVFEGVIDYKLRNAKRVVNQRGVEVYSLTQKITNVRGKKGHAATVATPIRPDVLRDLGPFRVQIYWYNRLIVEAIEGLTNKTTETREQIARWSGGPMLYRHGFRVLPYGDPDDDWLELDKNAFGQSGFKLNRQQVIGRVQVSSPHKVLSEQTNREGLVDSPSASALKAMLMWLMHTELRGLINEADKAELLTKREAEAAAQEFRQTEVKVRASLQELRACVPESSRLLVERLDKTVTLMADQAAEVARKTEFVLKESADDREKFVHLAGIGLMTEFIFHELDRSVAHAIVELQEVRKEFPSNSVLRNLEDQLATLLKRISAFDALTGEKRQVKARFEIGEVVSTVIQGHTNQFARHRISIHVVQDKPIPIRAVKGMLIQILENLIANSVYWLKQQAEYEPGFEPSITININANQRSLSVIDNGPGVDPERCEVIFHPFVSSKPANQGRGLGLYISRELAQYHGWRLSMDPGAETVRTGRLNTFLLELGNEK